MCLDWALAVVFWTSTDMNLNSRPLFANREGMENQEVL